MTSSWWNPERHADRRPWLLTRARLKAEIRAWYASQDFIEVDTACLQHAPGNETHLHAFATERISPDLVRQPLYLHTSPEFAMKKLLAAGENKIFSLGPVFRNREHGTLHLNEFSMLEWYRTQADYHTIIDDCTALLQLAATVSGTSLVSYRGRSADLLAQPQHLTVADAFKQHAHIDVFSTISEDGYSTDVKALAAQAEQRGIKTSKDDTWSDVFSKVLIARIEPHLGIGQPTFLTDYPITEAALAHASQTDPRVAERFELYCCGVELANGFGELTDAAEQRQRFETAMDDKQRIYGERYPIDADFLAALEHMPEASGAALGFDRLVMLVTGAERIDQIVWTPPDADSAR
ncbi:MAG: EF-P lysine aminoacylase GenX [Alphaproteobacteria bacterium]|nr:EF-P lysine aminoacylase GenX [Alphaproteobacteria bacterium]